MKNLAKSYPRLSVGMAVVLSGFVGCSPSKTVEKKEVSPSVVQVKAVSVTATPIRKSTLQPATIDAYYRAEIRVKAYGFVREINSDLGDFVQTGDVLAVIDVPELAKERSVIEAKIQRLMAEERRSEAGIQLATARVRSAEARLAETKSQMSGAEASLAASEAEFSRTNDLVRRGSLQQRMLDEVRLIRDSEAAQKEAMNASVDSAQAEVAVAQAQVSSAKSDLDAAVAETEITRRELELLEVRFNYATVRSPISGVVTHRGVEMGDLVREQSEVGSGEALFVISQVDKVRVHIPVPESDAPFVQAGDEVKLSFPSFASEKSISASVTRRAGSLDPSTRTMMVEVELPNDEGKLLPGMFGQALISIGKEQAANTLPAQAIRFREDGTAYVYVISSDDAVTVAQVTTGVDDGNQIEVLSGVKSGQRVIGAHLQRFVDGQKVKPL
ncbi:efflux RND transporter periplasmic adaptor subunit [Rubripirellula reticaptiva]|uniref:Toluene efflux pump periplasmic linker protein TtgD n=1 Tax=Rubripirellula reticaptiva TaxID=2528013 RepID=A0A5C6F3Q2_9BACT|nr:efflux RND transporter periplasmic adaptor subunit [Rubripirellula reticaptiva]TWU55067.1 Toluene efflux pump periplasmic linker protein TtgD precursor [Rubripirellula reticaptiva]